MSELSPRRSGPPSRRSREQRAYRLAVVGGVAGLVGVVGGLLAIFGVLGWGLPIIAVIIAIVCFFIFRRTVSP
jgi:hypothetical protein